MSIYEVSMGLMATGIIGRIIVCAPLMLAGIAGYIGCGHMAKVDDAAAKAARNTRYN